MINEKTVKDLTVKELLEDLARYTNLTQIKCPPFVDSDFAILNKYINELQLRNNKDKSNSQGFQLKRIADALEIFAETLV